VFSPDGTLVLASFDGRRIELRNADGDLLRVFVQPAEAKQLTFAPDGRRFVAVGADHAVRIWTLDGELLSTLRGHTDAVNGAVFTPDGTRVLTSSRDGTVRTWFANNEELRAHAYALPIREFRAPERERYAELLGDR
jgi:WD40 repeat protein